MVIPVQTITKICFTLSKAIEWIEQNMKTSSKVLKHNLIFFICICICKQK